MAEENVRCPSCGGVVDSATLAEGGGSCPTCFSPLGTTQTAGDLPGPEALLGRTLGGFEIHEFVGRGGMGTVYKARQPALDRLVAIKVIRASPTGDKEFLQRFLREARAAAAIVHTNIVQIYTVGEDQGYHYIAMEYVEGEDLGHALRRQGRLPAKIVLSVTGQVAAALAEAHARGVVHRDIKPSNILVTPDGTAKVADFGLAKRLGADVSVTATGTALGTPLYMSPEVAKGQPADALSDLYSLGATIYHLLAGQPPFEGANLGVLAIKHAYEKPTPVTELAPQTPPALCALIHRLLSKDPAERYPSARALLAGIRSIETGMVWAGEADRPEERRAESPGRRGEAPRRRLRAAVAAVVGKLPAMVFGLGVMSLVVMWLSGAFGPGAGRSRVEPPVVKEPLPPSDKGKGPPSLLDPEKAWKDACADADFLVRRGVYIEAIRGLADFARGAPGDYRTRAWEKILSILDKYEFTRQQQTSRIKQAVEGRDYEGADKTFREIR